MEDPEKSTVREHIFSLNTDIHIKNMSITKIRQEKKAKQYVQFTWRFTQYVIIGTMMDPHEDMKICEQTTAC